MASQRFSQQMGLRWDLGPPCPPPRHPRVLLWHTPVSPTLCRCCACRVVCVCRARVHAKCSPSWSRQPGWRQLPQKQTGPSQVSSRRLACPRGPRRAALPSPGWAAQVPSSSELLRVSSEGPGPASAVASCRHLHARMAAMSLPAGHTGNGGGLTQGRISEGRLREGTDQQRRVA